MELNLLPFIIEAMGYNKKIYKDIDRLYQKHKYEFYNAAKSHELYTHQIVTEGNLLQEEYCKKALGIILVMQENKDFEDEFFNILGKGWPYAFAFVNSNSEVDLSKFMIRLIKKSGGIDKLSDDEINTNVFMCFYIAICANKKIVENAFYKKFINSISARWEHYKDECLERISINRATDEDKEKINQIRFKLGKIRTYDNLYKDNDFAELLALIFDYENISASSIFDGIKLSQKEIDELIYLNVIDNESTDNLKHLTYSMYIRLLIKAYKKVKQHYFENNKETMYVEMEGLEKALIESQQEILRLKNSLSEVLEIHEALSRENSRLKQQLKEAEQNRQELIALREFMFNLDRQEEYTVDDKLDMDFLKTCKAIVVGGHKKWQARMKELLTNFIFIHPDNLNFDIKLLNNVDTVFIYVNYMNHAMYYKVMAAIEDKNIKIVYLNQQNDDIVLRNIQRVYRNQK